MRNFSLYRSLAALLFVPAVSASAGLDFTFAAPKSRTSAPRRPSARTPRGRRSRRRTLLSGSRFVKGGYIFAGKAMECGDTCTGTAPNKQNAGMTEAFAVKLSSSGAMQNGCGVLNLPSKNDAANGLVELADESIIVAGWRTVSTGEGKASLTKLSSTGTEKWTFTGLCRRQTGRRQLWS